MEWMNLAYNGWLNMNGAGKYSILLFLALLCLWGRHRVWTGCRESEDQKVLRIYATVMTVACVCPVTAAFLMMYQTRFYHYPWVWSLVPVTIVIAWALTQLFTDMKECRKLKGWKLWLFVLACVALIVLSGDLGKQERRMSVEKEQLIRVEQLVAELQAQTDDRKLCLWAPQEVVEHARIVDTNITLVYGRNMWDGLLNGYSYDSYGPEEVALYKAMKQAEDYGSFTEPELLCTAEELGVTHLILPGQVSAQHVADISRVLDCEMQQIQGYYVLRVLH